MQKLSSLLEVVRPVGLRVRGIELSIFWLRNFRSFRAVWTRRGLGPGQVEPRKSQAKTTMQAQSA